MQTIKTAAREGQTLSASLPRLIIEARKISAGIIHGSHGRRQAGFGEDFWAYRRFSSGEAAHRIDWRRSARDASLFVREHEWQAAQTFQFWIDRSESMETISPLAWDSKASRALVMAFALADILVKGGERVAIAGVMRPSANRTIIEKMAENMIHDEATDTSSLPPLAAVSPRTEMILLTDVLRPTEDWAQCLQALSSSGARGHLVQILDPAEEAFPYKGHIIFKDPESAQQITAKSAGEWQAAYQARLRAHREAIAAATNRHGWRFLTHHTDRPASEAVLTLYHHMRRGLSG